MVDDEILVPDFSYIRLMWNIGREDEHFGIIDKNTVWGISNLPAHAGREGTFNAQELLDDPTCPLWEAHHFNPKKLYE